MVFNSLAFLYFFIPFFLLYWFVFNKSVKLQNLLLLVASYIFYAVADLRFLSFLIGISLLNYLLGIYIEKSQKPQIKKLLLYIGLIQGLGGLAFFKYYNFFITSFNDLFHSFNVNLNLQTLNIIIPLGISFFTFRTVSYILDVNKGKIQATKDWIVFFNYVSFFPSILSGPIDKAKSFVPQLEKKREFNYNQAADGLRQILWGLFKKVIIADNCATITNHLFNNYQHFPGSTLLIGAFLYAIQIYADFSGYSDMAIGFSHLIGFNVTKNFNYPFFSQNIAEFWRRWHMSLTAWLTEYVFTPLSIAFRDWDKFGLILAIIANFTIVGIWHGANWTYVLFGFLHGCYFIPLILKGTMNKKKTIAKNTFFPTFREALNVLMTFTLAMFTFILFRADNIRQAISYIARIFSRSFFSIPSTFYKSTMLLIALFMLIEWMGREREYAIADLLIRNKRVYRWAFYVGLCLMIILLQGRQQKFIYFQF